MMCLLYWTVSNNCQRCLLYDVAFECGKQLVAIVSENIIMLADASIHIMTLFP